MQRAIVHLPWRGITMSQMYPDQQPDALSGETNTILRFGIEMTCREGISDPGLAVIYD